MLGETVRLVANVENPLNGRTGLVIEESDEGMLIVQIAQRERVYVHRNQCEPCVSATSDRLF